MNSHAAIIAEHAALPRQPRAVGQARVVAAPRGGRTALTDLHHSGSARAMFPRTGTPDLQAVLLNTAGGVTGGDRFKYAGAADSGAALTLTTQAAERAYRAQPLETGRVSVHLRAGSGATMHWLPQETILFDGARLERRLDAELASDAALLVVEPLVFGRTAMGERLSHLHLADHWRVRRDGVLVFADALRLSGPAEEIIARPAVLAGNRAMASVLYAAPDAEARLASLRTLLPDTAGASLVRPGVLAARIVAADGMRLRRALVPALELLRGARLPKVWRL